MKLRIWQFSVRSLLGFTTVVAVATIGYLYSTILALIVMAAAAAFIGSAWFQERNDYGFSGAVLGGSVGGVLWLLVHLVIGYTMAPFFEDSGVGFIGSLIGLSPYPAFAGALVGGLCWSAVRLAAYFIRAANIRPARSNQMD